MLVERLTLMGILRCLPAASSAAWSSSTGTPHTSPMKAANLHKGTLANSTCLNDTDSRCSISAEAKGADGAAEASSADESSTASSTGGVASSSGAAATEAAESAGAAAERPIERHVAVCGGDWFESQRRRGLLSRQKVGLRGKRLVGRRRCSAETSAGASSNGSTGSSGAGCAGVGVASPGCSAAAGGSDSLMGAGWGSFDSLAASTAGFAGDFDAGAAAKVAGLLVVIQTASQTTAPNVTPPNRPPPKSNPSRRTRATTDDTSVTGASGDADAPAGNASPSLAAATSAATGEAACAALRGGSAGGTIADCFAGSLGRGVSARRTFDDDAAAAMAAGTTASAADLLTAGLESAGLATSGFLAPVASPNVPGELSLPSPRRQSGGGTICTILWHFGQARISPMTDSSLTTSRAWQVVHCMVNKSTAGPAGSEIERSAK